jgi:hypothetical protein
MGQEPYCTDVVIAGAELSRIGGMSPPKPGTE